MDTHPLKIQRIRVKTDEEITRDYPRLLRRTQTTLDNHQTIHKLDEYEK